MGRTCIRQAMHTGPTDQGAFRSHKKRLLFKSDAQSLERSICRPQRLRRRRPASISGRRLRSLKQTRKTESNKGSIVCSQERLHLICCRYLSSAQARMAAVFCICFCTCCCCCCFECGMGKVLICYLFSISDKLRL